MRERRGSRVLLFHFCSVRQSERWQCRSLLSTLAADLKFKVDNGLVSLLKVYERVLGKIADLDHSAAKGARVRSRVRWAEEGGDVISFLFAS